MNSPRVSIGAVIWVYISEVFPNRVRSKGQSLGSSAHWIMNAIISGAFPVMAARSRAFPFVFFSAAMVVYFFIVLFTYTHGIASAQAVKAAQERGFGALTASRAASRSDKAT